MELLLSFATLSNYIMQQIREQAKVLGEPEKYFSLPQTFWLIKTSYY